ncbi:ribonuclease H [Patescibacteria group bacterium]
MSKPIIVYTDGSSRGNPGPGGYGAIILHDGKEVVLRGGEQETTNNRMEMKAILEALKWIAENPDDAEIYSDSSLVINSITKGWKRKKNIDIWEEIDAALSAIKTKIKWNWVKGHADNEINNRVDEIAVKEAMKFDKIEPTKDLGDGYYCKKCNANRSGRLSYNLEADMIRVDCEKCDNYIMFAEKTPKNLKEAKKRILATKKQIEAIKLIKEDQGEKANEKELKKLTKEEASKIINSAQTLWD